MYPHNFCYDCFLDEWGMCMGCAEFNDFCLNCIVHGIDQECLNCSSEDEAVDLGYDIANLSAWIDNNYRYWLNLH